MKKPLEDITEELRAALEKLKPKPDQIYTIHNNMRRLTNQFDTPGPDMERIRDFNVPHDEFPVPVRLYEPKTANDDVRTTLIYIHGGGFVTCSIQSHDGICRRIADSAGCRVLSIEYRLAPQFPFPAGPDDCEHVLNWVMNGEAREYGINPENIALGGDSAGGNMTAYLVQKYRDRIKAQILYYPLMQLVDVKPPNPGPQDNLQLGVMALKFIDQHYVKDADTQDTRLSPLFEENLAGIPPTYLLTCELDPLRDEGRAYADKLEAAGNLVTSYHAKALPHGFLNFGRAFKTARKIPIDTADFLREHMTA